MLVLGTLVTSIPRMTNSKELSSSYSDKVSDAVITIEMTTDLRMIANL